MIKFGDADMFLAGGSEASIVDGRHGCVFSDESAQHAQRRSAQAPRGHGIAIGTDSS